MLEISIALVIVACIAGWLVNKYLDKKFSVNTKASDEALSVAIADMHKTFDSRINKSFENHQLIRTELDSLKLQIGMKGIK